MLSRKKNETLVITAEGKRIEIVVVEIRGDKVRLGAAADADVIIDRGEVDHAKQRQRKAG